MFYDVLLGVYSVEELESTPDLWGFVSANASPLRSFFIEGEVHRCDEGAKLLAAQWAPAEEEAATLFGVRMFPRAGSVDASRELLLASLPISYDYLINASRSASELLRQNMMINALQDGLRSYAATTNAPAAIAAYRDARAQAATLANYQAIGVQAQTWVPMLQIVFQGIYIGSFVLVTLLFVMPLSVSLPAIKVYLGGFVWLASWGPLYAILNRIASGRAANWSYGASTYLTDTGVTQGLTLATQPGLVSVQISIAAMAGYMAMSIPFIAYAIARGGVGSFTHMAGSILGPVLRSTGAAAEESTLGNISLGNTQQDNHTFDTVTGTNLRTSPFAQAGEAATRQTPDGGMYSAMADGRTVVDNKSAMSSGGPVHISKKEHIATGFTEQSRTSLDQSQSDSVRSSDLVQAGRSGITSLAMDASHSKQVGQGVQASTSHSVNESLEGISSFVNTVSEGLNLSQDDALKLAITGKASGGFNLGLAKLSVEGSAAISQNTRSGEVWSDMQRSEEAENFRNAVDHVESAARSNSLNLTDSYQDRYGKSITQNYTESENYETQSQANLQKSQAASQLADLARSQSGDVTHDYNQRFMEYLGEEGYQGNALGSLLNDPVQRATLDGHVSSFVEQEVESAITAQHQQTLSSTSVPSSADDLRAAHTSAAADMSAPTRESAFTRDLAGEATERGISLTGGNATEVQQRAHGTEKQATEKLAHAEKDDGGTHEAMKERGKEKREDGIHRFGNELDELNPFGGKDD